MTNLRPGDIVTGLFCDEECAAVVVSSTLLHAHSGSAVACLLSPDVAEAGVLVDYVLHDWEGAGLSQPFTFRPVFATVEASRVTKIGRLSPRDWDQVRTRLVLALEF